MVDNTIRREVVSEKTDEELIKETDENILLENLYKLYQMTALTGEPIPEEIVFENIHNASKLITTFAKYIGSNDKGLYINGAGVKLLKDLGFIEKTREDLEKERQELMIKEGFLIIDERTGRAKLDRKKVVDYIIRENPYIFTLSDTEEIYNYEDGVYRIWSDAKIKEYIKKLIGEFATRTQTTEILNQIRYERVISRKELNKYTNLINLKNGMFDLENFVLLEHSPKYMSTIRIPVKYNPDAKCPEIESFLEDILDNEADILGIYELAGYLLVPTYEFSKAWMFLGEGNNGKSTLISLLEKFIGENNCVHVPLQRLISSRFLAAELEGKLMNSYADIPAYALKDVGLFKVLTGGDTLSAEKKFKAPFSFKNVAKLVFSCNQLPLTYEDTSAFFRRWIIIQFNKVIENPDEKILDKLTTEEELSGFLNKALEGLKRLRKNRRFSNEVNTETLAEEYKKMSDPTYAFFSEMLKTDSEGYIKTGELYSTFTEYCRNTKIPIISKQKFFDRLQAITNCYKTRKTIEGKKEWVMVGISYRQLTEE